MGQCMSRKAAGAFAASAATAHNRPTSMNKHKKLEESPDDEKAPIAKKSNLPCTKGVAMSFGFKKRPVTSASIVGNASVGRRLASPEIIDRNGNSDTDCLTSNAVPSGRTTPRLAPPRKEPNATRVSRFGFRQPPSTRYQNRVADVNAPPPRHAEYGNNNLDNVRANITHLQAKLRPPTDSNRNKPVRVNSFTQPQITRFTLQTTQLPKPQLPERVIETKTAKTLVNNTRKIYSRYQSDTESSSKEGSMTEDSGVGSHTSGEKCEVPTIEALDSSPTFRRYVKPRNLHVVVSGNRFDVRDLDENTETKVSLPPLPMGFHNDQQNYGLVRERQMEYKRSVEKSNRKTSVTSSEGFSEDERFNNEKNTKQFLKARPSPRLLGSDDHEWAAGEAMADDTSCCFSSSDESRGRESTTMKLTTASVALQILKNSPITNPLAHKKDANTAVLTNEDPKFAAVAEASNTSALLEDETSPTESLLCSYSEVEEMKNRMNKSSSNSKDINEKLTPSPPSPGTPTNVSLSLSDGKDFFVDDEIADQPALIFDDTLTNDNAFSAAQPPSETSTLIDSTPKSKRKSYSSVKESPLPARTRKFLPKRSGSLDTLSPCESIASDDLMMDFEYSQSSGLDDIVDRLEYQCNGLGSYEDDKRLESEGKRNDSLKDWPSMLSTASPKHSPKSMMRTQRLLRSRNSTPSSVPDSPRSLDSRLNVRPRPSLTNSPLRPPRGSAVSSAGYESDDSIKFERSNHLAMAQDVMSIKTMLLKLKRVLHETNEETLLRSETHSPFDNQHSLKNGFFNGLSSEATSTDDESTNTRMELAELKRQVLFLQGQLEDKEKSLQAMQEQMARLVNDHETAHSAPASTVADPVTCNAATQTERVRPISAGPSLYQGSSLEEGVGSLVSASETPRKSRTSCQNEAYSSPSPSSKTKTTSRLWRRPGEPPSPQRYGPSGSSIPRRANSRTRAPSTPS